MAYQLNSVMTFGEMKDLTISNAIKSYYPNMKGLIGKYPDWYSQDVKDYLKANKPERIPRIGKINRNYEWFMKQDRT